MTIARVVDHAFRNTSSIGPSEKLPVSSLAASFKNGHWKSAGGAGMIVFNQNYGFLQVSKDWNITLSITIYLNDACRGSCVIVRRAANYYWISRKLLWYHDVSHTFNKLFRLLKGNEAHCCWIFPEVEALLMEAQPIVHDVTVERVPSLTLWRPIHLLLRVTCTLFKGGVTWIFRRKTEIVVMFYMHLAAM